MEGGELFSRIQERGDQAFTERGLCGPWDLWGVRVRRLHWSCYDILAKACLSLNLKIHLRTEKREMECLIPSRGLIFEEVTLKMDYLWS